jgi:syntaxin 8
MSAHPPTAARLSSLSTTTLSQILELTRSHRLYLPPSPSLTNSIKKNLILHRKGIESLTASEGKTDVVRALGDQEERLLELLDGLGVVLEGVQRGKTGRLVDTGEDDQKDEQDDDDLIVQDDSG